MPVPLGPDMSSGREKDAIVDKCVRRKEQILGDDKKECLVGVRRRRPSNFMRWLQCRDARAERETEKEENKLLFQFDTAFRSDVTTCHYIWLLYD